MIGLVLIGVFALMLILNVPVGIALGIASLVTVLSNPSIGASDTYIVQNLVTAIDSFPLMAVPFFVLAGELMSGGGISKRLLNTFNCFFGRITGGLAIVAVVACMFFAAISGSGPATVAAIGGMVLPTMLEKGYDRKFILGLLAAAGCIGVIIPPSIPMVIYGVSTNASITDLFLAGFIPGIVIGLALIAVSYSISRKHGWRDTELHLTGREKLRTCLLYTSRALCAGRRHYRSLELLRHAGARQSLCGGLSCRQGQILHVFGRQSALL